MLKTYPAIFHAEKDGYWVEFNDFAGGTAGDNLNDAMANARDFLEGAVATYIDEDMPLPEPSNIKDLKITDGFVTLIQIDPTPFIKYNKAIRKNVTIPEWLVKRADRKNINYSETLTKALEVAIQS